MLTALDHLLQHNSIPTIIHSLSGSSTSSKPKGTSNSGEDHLFFRLLISRCAQIMTEQKDKVAYLNSILLLKSKLSSIMKEWIKHWQAKMYFWSLLHWDLKPCTAKQTVIYSLAVSIWLYKCKMTKFLFALNVQHKIWPSKDWLSKLRKFQSSINSWANSWWVSL